MKKHSSANILLIELVLVILFFMLCVSTIVEMFGLARGKSSFARDASQAVRLVENLEARLAASGDAESLLSAEGFLPEEDRWVLDQGNWNLTASFSEEKSEAGVLRTVHFTAEQDSGKLLFELPVTHYQPGEVSP